MRTAPFLAFIALAGPMPPLVLRELPRELTENRVTIALTPEARTAFLMLSRAAEGAGISLSVRSGYRSEETQARIYEGERKAGVDPKILERAIAAPGKSSHARGTAIDFAPAGREFARTAAYGWLKQNAARFGFFETYAKGNSRGMEWEPWHFDFTSR